MERFLLMCCTYTHTYSVHMHLVLHVCPVHELFLFLFLSLNLFLCPPLHYNLILLCFGSPLRIFRYMHILYSTCPLCVSLSFSFLSLLTHFLIYLCTTCRFLYVLTCICAFFGLFCFGFPQALLPVYLV